MLSSYIFPVFLEFVPIIDFEDKVGKLVFEFFFTYSCLVEEIEYEFLRIWQIFPDRREKSRLLVSQLDDQSAMFFL